MRVLLGFIAAGVLALGVAVAVTLGGFYDIAATKPHLAPVYWWLKIGMRRSVQTHAAPIKVPTLGDEAQVLRGFRHFQTGCVICHSARGLPAAPTVWRQQPEAPDLTETVPTWAANELFWITKHGLKMTGMPAWEAQERDDEVWDIVAFLQMLPRLTPEQLAAMSRADASDAVVQATEGRLIAIAGPPQKAEAACVRCHGYDGAGHPSGAFPRLNGLDATYLHEALRHYARGTRPSGFMAPVARALTDDEMRLVAQHYASMPAGASPTAVQAGDLALLQKGAALAAIGAPGGDIAACTSCHAAGKAPVLDGQYRDYVAQQLTLWKAGRRRSDADDTMGRIARAMTEDEIRAVAVYYSTLPGRAAAE